MASLSGTVGAIEESEETSGVNSRIEAGINEPSTESAEVSTQNHLAPIRNVTEGPDVTQELGSLLRDVLIQLRQDLSHPSNKIRVSDGQNDDDTSSATSQSRPDTEPPMIREVRKVDFEHFKNQFHENDGRHIIEALIAGSRLPQAVREESLKRQKRRPGPFSTLKPESSASSVTPRDGTIRRVRIRSPAILYYLSRLADAPAELDGTRTFLYPFVPLLYFQEDMRRILNLLEEKWTPSTGYFSQAVVEPSELEQDGPLRSEVHTEAPGESAEVKRGSSSAGPRLKTEVTLDSGFDTPATLEEFRVYVAFVDEDLSPLADRYSDTSRQSVTFEDLWLLFKPGDYVSTTIGPKTLIERRNMPNCKFHFDQEF